MKKKILVVSQYFYPEQFRINDMCEEWVKKGYDVTVLTGIPNYPQGDFYKGYSIFKKRKENYKGINIKRLWLIPRKKNSLFLALNYISFMISGYFWAVFTKEKYDEVFIYEVSPMTQAVPGVRYAKKHNIQSMIYVMDLWPENFIEMSGITNKVIVGWITGLVNYIYKNIDKILISSPDFKRKIIELGDYSSKIEYWPQYAEDFYKPTKVKSEVVKLDNTKFNITFAGNIGYAQGLESLPLVAKKLNEENINVKFNIIGNGRYKTDFKRTIHDMKLLEYFNFYDSVEAIEIPKIMSQTDVALVSLSPSPLFSLTIPAKVQSIMATGTPLLVSADGVLEKIIFESQAGLYSKAGDINKMVENIKIMAEYNESQMLLLKNNAIAYSEKEFSKEILLNKIDDFWR